MTAADQLAQANRYPLKLANGVQIEYRLPMMEELVVARLLPLTLLDDLRKRMETGGTATEAESVAEHEMSERLAEYETEFEAKQRVVALMVLTVNGEAADLSPGDTVNIPAEDFRTLIACAMRQEPARAEGEV